jgi:transcriptional regulator with XRE-family HTH domain
MFGYDEELKEKFLDRDYREAYADDYLNTYVAMQIQVLREQRGLSQKELAESIGTQQPGVSRLEDVNHENWKTETLKKVAHALGVRLKISFETYGDLLRENEYFGRRALQRPKFEEDPVINPAEAMGGYFQITGPAPAKSLRTQSTGIATARTSGTPTNSVVAA